MAQTPFSLLLRRLSSENHKLSLLLSHGRSIRPFSTSQPNPSDPKPSTLSSRMSFVFDQIDVIEREQWDKDQTLQRIRAWRQAKKVQNQKLEPQPKLVESIPKPLEGNDRSKVELVHPWPEWIELIDRLVQQKYFDFLADQQAEAVVSDGFDFTKDFKTIQTACINLGKDRFDILRSLPRQDIQILVGHGCPSADKKVAFSGKLLRKHVHLDEGDVCSSCSLRNSCVRAFLIPKKEDEARTIDVMRVLLTFAFDPDPDNGSVENKSVTKHKSVKTVVRKLLHQVVKLSAVPIDPNLPPPVIRKPPPKVKQPPTPKKKRIGRDDVEMKKGDWLCSKCDFLNFAKNTVCLQCDANRPKRQLLPGEWECPECTFLNYRRNVVCFHCECKRPPDAYTEGSMQEKPFGARTNFEKLASRPEVSNAWNFDFDDDESDGADVAAFENADSAVRNNIPFDGQKNYREFGNSTPDDSRARKDHEREFSNRDSGKPGMGFDDFDDFDDVNNYELETPDNPTRRVSANDLSKDDGYSESEDGEGSDYNMSAHTSTSSPPYHKPLNQKSAMSGSEDDDIDMYPDAKPSVHSKWNSNDFDFADDEEEKEEEDSLFSGAESDGMDRRGNLRVLESDDRNGPKVESRRKGISNSHLGTRSSDKSPRPSYNYRDSECDRRNRSSTRGNSKGGNNRSRFSDRSDRRGNLRVLESDDRNGPKVESRRKGISNSHLGTRSSDKSPRPSYNYSDSECDRRNRSSTRGNSKGGNNRSRFSDRSARYKDSESDEDEDDDDDVPSQRNQSKRGHEESSRRGGSSLTRKLGFRSNGFDEGNNRRFEGDRNDGRKRGAGNMGKSGLGRGGVGKRPSGRCNENSMDKDFGEVRNSRRIIER